MRIERVLVALIAAAGLLAGAGSSAATEGGPTSSLQVDGTTSDGYTVKTNLEQRGKNPFNVKGYVDAQFVLGGELLSMRGPATCLDVRVNTAGGIFRVENPGAFRGAIVYASFVDGGPGGTDRFTALTLPGSSAPQGCAPRADISLLPFVRGGLVIDDGKIGNQKTEDGEK